MVFYIPSNDDPEVSKKGVIVTTISGVILTQI